MDFIRRTEGTFGHQDHEGVLEEQVPVRMMKGWSDLGQSGVVRFIVPPGHTFVCPRGKENLILLVLLVLFV
jgi:hypothetical protein